MKKLCVIGDPVGHSKSPLIQNTMIEALGLDYVYLSRRILKEDTALWLKQAKAEGYAGFNATMPHKEALVPLVDELGADAKRFGSVNTVCIKNNKIYGYSTDGQGFLRALEEIGVLVPGKRVTILGAGGAAKAVALKLAQVGAERVTVCNRTPWRAEELCKQNAAVLRPAGLDIGTLSRLAEESDLLINCTSLGMEGVTGQFEDFSFLDALPPCAAVCDLIYAPAETELLARARSRGHRTMNGLGMLIHQAILSLELFADIVIDAPAMAALVRSVLK